MAEETVANRIEVAAKQGEWWQKVETRDPKMSLDQEETLIHDWQTLKTSSRYKWGSPVIRTTANLLTRTLNWDTKISGLENLKAAPKGIITSNHFHILENTAVRTACLRAGRPAPGIVIQASNLAQPGVEGMIMRYYPTVPVGRGMNYMGREFLPQLERLLDRQKTVLIYPEQEMWFNYRKPRPPKRGTYYYAAKLGVPVIPMFVGITKDGSRPHFAAIVGQPLYPTPGQSVAKASKELAQLDWNFKQAAYEQLYGRPYTANWEGDELTMTTQTSKRQIPQDLAPIDDQLTTQLTESMLHRS